MHKYNSLIVASETMDHRIYMRNILGNDYGLLEASNAEQILVLLRQNRNEIAALLLDVSHAQTLDLEILGKEEYAEMKQVPIIVLTQTEQPDLLHRGFELGAADVIPLNYETFALLHRIETIVELNIHKKHSEATMKNSVEQLQAKYRTLTQYIDNMLVEVNLSQDICHVVYNPYPELKWLEEISNFSEFRIRLDEKNRQFSSHLEQFIGGNFRRYTCQLCINANETFEAAMLRADYVSTSEEAVLILLKRIKTSSEEQLSQEIVKNRLQQYEIILAQTENILFEWDVKEDKIEFSETWNRLFKYPPAFQSMNKILRDGDYFHPDDFPLFSDQMTKLKEGSNYEVEDVRISVAGGYYIWCRIRATAIRGQDGSLEKIYGIILKIDKEKKAEEHMQREAERDSLTKLLNKKTARRRSEEYLSRIAEGTPCAMMIIDLDNFKYVNDHYGHLFGDTVLMKVSKAISKLFRDQDIVARIGGDEFMVLMRGINDRTILENRCLRLLNVLTGLFRNEDQRLPISCSIGVAVSPENGVAYYDLFNKADQALYQVKSKGKNSFAFYENIEEQPLHNKIGISAVNNPIDSEQEPENLVNTVLHRLYSSQNVEESIREILAMVGRMTNVSRVYVFENSDDNTYCCNTYEWCNEGITSEKENLQNVSYESDIPGYQENFDERGIFYCADVRVLPAKTYEILKTQNVKSMLQCAIRENNVFRGYIGFDECVEQRMWTKEHIKVLSDFSELLSVFLMKHREHERTLEVSRKLDQYLANSDIEEK